MKTLATLLVGFALIAVSISSGNACDFCMLGQGISPYLTANGKGITLSTDFVELDKVYNGRNKVDSNGKKESWLTYSATGFYSLTEELTALLTVPYAVKTNIDFDETSGLNPGTLTTGIGDVTLTGRYTLIKVHSLESTLIGGALLGLKIPTGATGTRDRSGEPVDRHGLPGTGSLDFDVGITGSYAQASGFQVTLDVADRVSATGKWAGRDHRYGNMLNYTVKAFQRVARSEAGASLQPFLGISGETMGKETGTVTDDGYDSRLKNPSTGGTVLLGDLGLFALLSPTTTVSASFSKAFYRDMNFSEEFDADPAENYKVDLALTVLF